MLLANTTIFTSAFPWEAGGDGNGRAHISCPGLLLLPGVSDQRFGRLVFRLKLSRLSPAGPQAAAYLDQRLETCAGAVGRAVRARLAGGRRGQQDGRLRLARGTVRKIRHFYRRLSQRSRDRPLCR